MKLVDSQALERVAKALRLSGRTSGETDFDDEHLQQTLDVSRLVVGSTLLDGWLWHTLTGTHIITGSVDASITAEALMALVDPADPTVDRAWIMGVSHDNEGQSGTTFIDHVTAGIQFPAYPAVGGPTFYMPLLVAILANANANDYSATAGVNPSLFEVSSGSYQLLTQLPRPIPFFNGATLRVRSTATVAAGTVHSYLRVLFWIGPRGLNPPGLA